MKTFDFILQGSEATEENARAFALGFDWGEVETKPTEDGATSWQAAQFIDTLNGVEIYYNFGADYYFFLDATEEK